MFIDETAEVTERTELSEEQMENGKTEEGRAVLVKYGKIKKLQESLIILKNI